MGFSSVAGAAGIATAVIGAALAFLPVTGVFPNASRSAPEVAAYYSQNSASVIAQSIGSSLIFILVVVFATGLWTTLRERERERAEAWSVIGLLGSAALAATYTIAGALTLILARRVGGAFSGQDAVVIALNDMQTIVYQLGAAFMVLYLAGFSIAGQRSRAMPVWLCWIGYVTAIFALTGILSAAAPGTLAEFGFYFASLGFLLWTLVGGVRLLRGARRAGPANTPRLA
jgi:hypothetical protein